MDKTDDKLEREEAGYMASARIAEDIARKASTSAAKHRLDAADARAQRARNRLEAHDYLEAAKHFKEAAKLVPETYRDTRVRYETLSRNAMRSHEEENKK